MNTALMKKVSEIYNFNFIGEDMFTYEDSDVKILYGINHQEIQSIQKHCDMLPVDVTLISDIERTALSVYAENDRNLMIVFETEKGLIVMDYYISLEEDKIDADVMVYKANSKVNIDPVRLRELPSFLNHLGMDGFGQFLGGLKQKIMQLYFGEEATKNTIDFYYHGN